MAEQVKEKPKPDFELAVAGWNLRTKYGISDRENPDKLIAKKGMIYIEEIEKDTHLGSCLATRRQKLIKKGWDIKPARSLKGKSTARDREIADFVRDQLEDMTGSLEKDIEGMLDAVGKGFSLTEINYRYIEGGKWKGKTGLKSLRFKPAKYFSFKFDNFGHWTIVQIDPNPSGVELPGEKFIHLIAGSNDENPYGESVSARCAFWVWLKKNEAKFWAIYSERFGMPLVKVSVPRKVNETEKSQALEIIEEIQTTSGVRVPEGFDVGFLEAVRRGDVNYDNFIERCNKEISKLVFGATLISEEGKRGQGSYALGAEHATLFEDYIIFDAAITEQALNEQLIRRLVDYNYLTEYYPRFYWKGIDVSKFISLSQALGIMIDKGMKIPKTWAHDVMGIPMATGDEEVLEPGIGPAGPVRGVDNRSFAEEIGVNFDELPEDVREEVRQMDRIHQRYLKIAQDQRENILNKISQKIKKNGHPVQSCEQ